MTEERTERPTQETSRVLSSLESAIFLVGFGLGGVACFFLMVVLLHGRETLGVLLETRTHPSFLWWEGLVVVWVAWLCGYSLVVFLRWLRHGKIEFPNFWSDSSRG
jgi:hypothetical protein